MATNDLPVKVTIPDIPELRTVAIPGADAHEGIYRIEVTLVWRCPRCNGPRGKPYRTISWDGSRRLGCDGWDNPCGHVDFYSDVRREAKGNG